MSKRHWYHIQFVRTGDKLNIFCNCPKRRLLSGSCLHERFLQDYHLICFPETEGQFRKADCVELFLRNQLTEAIYTNLFSVARHGSQTRAIVSHEGSNDGAGDWECSKDSKVECEHVKKARDFLQQVLNCDPEARDTSGRAYSKLSHWS